METNEETQPKKKCCNTKLLKHLALQLFDFGRSAGSLITEALEIFKTFQRISAPVSFYQCFSQEVSPFFTWIKNIINIFADFFQTIPFDNFELYLLFCLIFPLAILMFISLMVNLKLGYIGLIACALFFTLGAGCGLCQGQEYIIFGIILIIISSLVIAIGLCKIRCKCCKSSCCDNTCKCYNFIFYMFIKPEKKSQRKHSHSSDSLQEQTDFVENNDDQNESDSNNSHSDTLVITRAFYPTSLVLYLIIIPIMVKREKYLKIASVVFSLLYLIVFPLNILIDKYFSNLMLKVSSKGLNFLVNCLSLLIIPATNSFVELIEEKRLGQIQCTLTYIFVSLIFPIILTNYMIKYKHPDIFNKYKRDHKVCCKYAGIEVWDYLKQMVYAVVAAFDLAPVCAITEFIWILIIVIKRPYRSVCEAVISIGHSVVAVLSNIGICYVFYTNSSSFDFKFSLIIVVAAFIPAIIAMYIFFSIEFNFDEEDEEETKKYNEKLNKSLKKVIRIVNIILPCTWFFFGINIFIITKGNSIRYD